MADEKHAPLAIHKESTGLVAGETLCVTRDGRVVREDDPEANEQIAVKGRPIPEKLVERYGIRATRQPKAGEDEEDEAPRAAAAEAKPATEEKPAAEAHPKALGEEIPSVTRRKIA